MATTMPTPGADADAAAEGEQPGMETDDDSGQIAELCIGVMRDGSLTVYMETGPEESEQESQKQTVSDIGQALKVVLDLYKQIDTQGQDAASQFDQGFGGNDGGTQRMARGFRA
jgi:hypothetical protein